MQLTNCSFFFLIKKNQVIMKQYDIYYFCLLTKKTTFYIL